MYIISYIIHPCFWLAAFLSQPLNRYVCKDFSDLMNKIEQALSESPCDTYIELHDDYNMTQENPRIVFKYVFPEWP